MLDPDDRRFAYEEPDWLSELGVADPRLRRLGAYWHGLRRHRSMPGLGQVTSWKIPDLLPIMWVWRVDREDRRFYLRLAGEEIQRAIGHWRRGGELGEVAPQRIRGLLRRRYEAVAFGPAVLHVRGEVLLGDLRVPAERLMLPLGEDGETADHIIGISHYDLSPRRDPATLSGEETRETRLPLDALA